LEYVDILFIDTECRESAFHSSCGSVEIKGVHFCGVSQEIIMLLTTEGIALLVNALLLFFRRVGKIAKSDY